MINEEGKKKIWEMGDSYDHEKPMYASFKK